MIIAVNTRFLIKDKLEGIGYFTYEVLKRLVLSHPEHQFVFFFDRSYPTDFVFASNVIPVVLFPPARHPFLFIAWFEWSVARALKRYKADVFLSPDNFLCLNTKVQTVLVVHDIAYKHFPNSDKWINRLYYRYFMPRFLRKASKILTVSEYTKSDILSHFPFLNKEKISVCYNGCRTIFTPLSILEQNKVKNQHTDGVDYFLFVGAVHPRKNVHRLIEAFDVFKKQTQQPHKLVICGRFAWQTGLVKSAYDEATHKKDIVFTGYLDDSTVAELMASAFALVYPSLFEGFGIPLLEAMYSEIPIITSDRSSLPEVAGEAALYVNPESAQSIAQAMEQLVFEPDLKAYLVEQGRKQRLLFNWEKTARIVYEAIYQDLTVLKR